MKKSLKERWNEECSIGDKGVDYFPAKRIISEAFYEGFIDWSTYQRVKNRIRTKGNGDWMFEKKADQKS